MVYVKSTTPRDLCTRGLQKASCAFALSYTLNRRSGTGFHQIWLAEKHQVHLAQAVAALLPFCVDGVIYLQL